MDGVCRHVALFYRNAQEYLAGALPFLASGPAAVAVPGPSLELLRSGLGSRARRVRVIDMAVAGRNPGRIIPAVLRKLADEHPGRRVKIIGEPIWAGRTDAEYPACLRHEALINLAFEGLAVTILCPYDAARLDPAVLADAEATHPVIVDSSGERPSRVFEPKALAEMGNVPLAEPATAQMWTMHVDATRMPRARAFLIDRFTLLDVDPERVLDAELAMAELLSNSLLHGGGSGMLRIWAEEGHAVCEVSDAGHITDPLAGRISVADSTCRGRGLLLVNQLSDLVRMHSTPAGTTTRIYFRLG